MKKPPSNAAMTKTFFESIRHYMQPLRGSSGIVAIIGILSIIIGLVLLLSIPELKNSSLIVLAIGGILLLAAIVSSIRTLGAAVIGRRGRYSANTIIMMLAFVGIIGLANFLAIEGTHRFDVTATKQFSLAQQTVDILRNLEEPVEATAFFVTGNAMQEVVAREAENLLHEFAKRSNKFTYRFIDPDIEPLEAQNLRVSEYQSIAFQAMGSMKIHQVQAPPIKEQDFVTALLIITGKQQKQVYFLSGHGERNPTDVAVDSLGFGTAVSGLQGDNYGVSTLNIVQRGSIPDNAAAIIIVAPTKELQKEEIEPINSYLIAGGRIIFLLETPVPSSFVTILKRWGVQVATEHLLDAGSSVSGNPRNVLIQRKQYFDSPITNTLDVSLFPGSTVLRPSVEELPDTINLSPLATSTPLSWLTGDPERNDFDQENDILFSSELTALWLTSGRYPTKDELQGSNLRRDNLFFPMVTIQALAPLDLQPNISVGEEIIQTKIVVFGDADFAANKYFYFSTNGDFFLNAVNWLTEDVSLISIRPKPQAFRQLILTKGQEDFIRYSSWFLLPLILAIVSAIVWWRRR